jgi:hypothetical protein
MLPDILPFWVYLLRLGCCPRYSKGTKENKNMVKSDLFGKWNYTSRGEVGNWRKE